ncbi:MAG: alanine dehydrogenase [Candidatus Fluviicola riflensis]|nr:MAG: alanine dehydrogenase [Candidatus Fluviicola riflensis]OGS79768.1 MAG: alanine dehydrogenase [Candidatus Fluviicola riflensis]OGS87201.1 MAG: alanine dehydrogenase [Fluviicola sp. RIFCSPHIGHO2_01_FULL_43_53]OGS89989.1 MAG: alanine dehydrogenase [Fluviicola sp. RIFCSPHIGHO2_12_FULL_43_24]
MAQVKLGIIREGKVPPDKRVPLTPRQCLLVKTKFPHANVVVQTSNVRAFKDEEYRQVGIEVVDDLHDCDIIMGVKEVNIEDLIPSKKFMFFSHTIKKQPYNRRLLQAVLDLKIQLIDYEVLKNKQNKRIIGFGRYAGIVGCYNGLLTYGKKSGAYSIKPANECRDRVEMEEEIKKIELPKDTKIVLTGFGRVGHGAREIMDLLTITEVSPEEFLHQKFDGPVFTHLDVEDYYARIDGTPFDKQDFYANPKLYKSVFAPYISVAQVYIACHFWSDKSPNIVTQEDFQKPEVKVRVVADISCDIAGPIACTIRPSKIADPVYGYDPATGTEVDPWLENNIAVMAVDNLPCELPMDASEDFGNELIKYVLPCLLGDDPDDVIGRGSETDLNGKLTERFAYLQDYVDGNTVSH